MPPDRPRNDRPRNDRPDRLLRAAVIGPLLLLTALPGRAEAPSAATPPAPAAVSGPATAVDRAPADAHRPGIAGTAADAGSEAHGQGPARGQPCRDDAPAREPAPTSACRDDADKAAGETADDGITRPLWELGMGVGGIAFPDYRGAGTHNAIAIPVPQLIYRGDFLKLSSEGARLDLFDGLRMELNFSGRLQLPSDSDDDGRRAGMPDLDAILELGPSVNVTLTDPGLGHRRRLQLRLAVRRALATDIKNIRGAGWVFHPHLDWTQTWRHDRTDLWLSSSVGPLWATEDHHAFFYSVAPEFATPRRPAFDADGGYSGTRLSATVIAQRGRLRGGLLVNFDHLGGAAFVDSPLVARRQSYLTAFFIGWSLWQSRRTTTELELE